MSVPIVDNGTMIDSHALVGKKRHISAARKFIGARATGHSKFPQVWLSRQGRAIYAGPTKHWDSQFVPYHHQIS